MSCRPPPESGPAGSEPTQRQQEMLATIRRLTKRRGFPPTLRELGAELGISSTNGVNDCLKALEKRRLITREEQVTRSLLLTASGTAYADAYEREHPEVSRGG